MTIENNTTIKEEGELEHKQIVRILTGLLLGMFLASLDQTIVSTAIKTIGDDLNGLSMQAWVTTAYLITSTIATPIYGKLGDIYGRKKLYLFAITVFIIGSLACSFATNMAMLASFRAIQGIGAGGLMSLAFAIIGDIVPPRQRAKYTGYFMAVFATSSVLGPVIGGLFAEASSIATITGWRWVFLVNVPIGILALFVVAKTLHLKTVKKDLKIDWFGAAALIVALVPLLTVAEQGRSWGWASGKSITAYAIGAIGVISFIIIEKLMKESALIPLYIFKNKTTSITIIASVILGVAMFGGMMVLPLYMQIVHNVSPMQSGLMMLPMVLGMMIAAMGSGQITAKTGRIREFPIIGSAIAAAAMFALSTINADTNLALVMVYMLFLGFGLGNCMQPLTLIIQNSVSVNEIGVASSAATFFRQIGATVGVSVFISMLYTTLSDNIKNAFKAAMPGMKQYVQANPESLSNSYNKAVVTGDPAIFSQINDNTSVLGKMSSIFSHPFKVGFADSISQIFLIAAIVMVFAVIVLLFLPKVELRKTSAMSERNTNDLNKELETVNVVSEDLKKDSNELTPINNDTTQSDNTINHDDSINSNTTNNEDTVNNDDSQTEKHNVVGSNDLLNNNIVVNDSIVKVDSENVNTVLPNSDDSINNDDTNSIINDSNVVSGVVNNELVTDTEK